MCGICFVLFESPSSSSSATIDFPFSDWLESTGLRESIQRRGPDHFATCSYRSIDDDNRRWSLHGASGVLRVRGCTESESIQPVVAEEDGSFLLFNGEIYDGLEGLSEDRSDTRLLFEQLRRRSTNGDELGMVSFVANLEGPFSVVYFDARNHRLWFFRDAFGRRSLLFAGDSGGNTGLKLILSSVASKSNDDPQWMELPAGYVFAIDFRRDSAAESSISDRNIVDDRLTAYRLRSVPNDDDQNLRYLASMFADYRLIEIESNPWRDLFNLTRESTNDIDRPREIQKFDDDDDAFENWYLETHGDVVDRFLDELRAAIRKRVRYISKSCHECPSTKCEHSKVALLFSGGVDSLLLAVLLAKELQNGDQSVDLLNVAFGSNPSAAPDRITGESAFVELRRLFPHVCHGWNFVKIDIDQGELERWRSRRIAGLIRPSVTVLDDSIGCVLWFAARGRGLLLSDGHVGDTFASTCRVLLLGSGADELLGGYSRHRKRYFDVSEPRARSNALIDELEMELRRIGSRNLARDDRVVADHSRETRLPYLDERFVRFVNALPLEIKCDLRRRRGVGEKLLLRMALRRSGFGEAFYRLPKRAMQFGTRIAKTENRKEKGNDRCDRLTTRIDDK